MAYLFDGGFRGALYSIKETGKKLANGAKVVVEDFISGFNGHGWKLWKNKDSWRLEIDEILVRKSLTVFEQIISQITSIKGSYAITQGHAKIKSVSIKDAEINKLISPIDFNSNFIYEGTGECLVKDRGIVIFTGEPETIHSFIYPTIMKSMTINISGLSQNMKNKYTYIDDKFNIREIELLKDGEYTLPASYSKENIMSGFILYSGINGIIKIEQRKTENILETVRCYSLEIEDETNSLLEHDFIRCQKGNKFYHVKIGSIFQYYINIPITEFLYDEEGYVINPPEIGDEIVQFGNESFDDKYKDRHSAIYMHVDNGEPCIDLMTDIYTKDWSNVITTRMGGNLPGTNGDRGLYCVNGKIMSVDETGEIVYVLNPDGSASFARGKLYWDKNGEPVFSGELSVGKKDGRRVEISPYDYDIKITNDNNEPIISFEGKSYDSIKNIFVSEKPSIQLDKSDIELLYGSKGVFYINKNINMLNSPLFHTNDNFTMSFFFEKLVVLFINRNKENYIDIKIILNEYNDENLENHISSTEVFSETYKTDSSTSLSGAVNRKINSNRYYTLYLKITGYISGTEFNESFIQLDINGCTIDFKNFGYKSKFFANGLMLGTSENSHFSVFNKKNSYGAENILFEMKNSLGGVKFSEGELSYKRNYYMNQESVYCLVPRILGSAIVTMNSSSIFTSYETKVQGFTFNFIKEGTNIFFKYSSSDINFKYSQMTLRINGIEMSPIVYAQYEPKEQGIQLYLKDINGNIVTGRFYIEILYI